MSESIPTHRPFEESLADLERLVHDLEDGQLGLDDALARYEQGVALLKLCHGQLRQAEQRILILTGVETDGQPILQPFKHEATVRAGLSRLRKRPGDAELPFPERSGE
jgi:exodeoxyribonuclease VII small subunit